MQRDADGRQERTFFAPAALAGAGSIIFLPRSLQEEVNHSRGELQGWVTVCGCTKVTGSSLTGGTMCFLRRLRPSALLSWADLEPQGRPWTFLRVCQQGRPPGSAFPLSRFALTRWGR